MAADWPSATIEDVAEKVAMGPFGSSIKVDTFVPTGIPVVSGQHLHGMELEDSEFNFISEEHADRLKNANVQRGDVIFTHAGNIGQAAYIPDNSRYDRYVISQRQFYMRCNTARVLPEFVVYYFKTPEGRHQLLANTVQTGVPSIAQPVTYLRTLRIPLPPLPEQRAIAQILGALDDKIELNRRMNETLEAIARALFKSWFVDFEPVRAKAKGRATGLPPHITGLFPDRFEDSELGEIPAGWRVLTLGELSHKPQYGFTASAQKEAIGPKFLRITDINKLPWIEWASVPYCEASTHELLRYRVEPGDILIARMADPGHGVMIEDKVDAVFASYLIRFRPKDKAYDRMLQYWLRSEAYWDLVGGRQTGTTRATLNAQVLSVFHLVAPPAPIAEAFGTVVSPLRARVTINVQESGTLAALRDTLLPKLISGELRVPDPSDAT
jgi:type I restriction enzyme S subunit